LKDSIFGQENYLADRLAVTDHEQLVEKISDTAALPCTGQHIYQGSVDLLQLLCDHHATASLQQSRTTLEDDS